MRKLALLFDEHALFRFHDDHPHAQVQPPTPMQNFPACPPCPAGIEAPDPHPQDLIQQTKRNQCCHPGGHHILLYIFSLTRLFSLHSSYSTRLHPTSHFSAPPAFSSPPAPNCHWRITLPPRLFPHPALSQIYLPPSLRAHRRIGGRRAIADFYGWVRVVSASAPPLILHLLTGMSPR